jgi:hypothetical protein
MQDFEATQSRANTGTGSRREGRDFEDLTLDWWDALARFLESAGAERARVRPSVGDCFHQLRHSGRTLLLPAPPGSGDPLDVPASWFQTDFAVSELVAGFPGTPEATARYAPGVGPYQGSKYPEMFSGMKTMFDATLVLIDKGVLADKILVEYKTAKASKGHQIDGNAHERLSFQTLQYLEIATKYPRCSFVVLANGAFVKYRNKYHVNFHVQADRLTAFSWFRMEHLCTEPEYISLAKHLAGWLFDGVPVVGNEKR